MKAATIDGVSIRLVERHEAIFARHVRKLESGDPFDRLQGRVASTGATALQGSYRVELGGTVEATDADVDRCTARPPRSA